MNRPYLLCTLICALAGPLPAENYAIVVSSATQETPEWAEVTAVLAAKHPSAAIHQWQKEVKEAAPALQAQSPRYTCFVAKSGEVTAEFVRAIHRLVTSLDEDPYTDSLWGILTGFDAANALEIANEQNPLTVRRVASGTEVELTRCQEGVWYCELQKNRMVRKDKNQKPVEGRGPDDTTAALAESLKSADLFVTSGHATERDWQIGYRYKNGSWRSSGGKLFGVPTTGDRFPISAPNAKIYLPIGNCLMGHIDGPDAMALAFLKSAGVRQMAGYIVPTWYGYQGWGLLDYFVEQPGRFSLAEAFLANHHALIHRLSQISPTLASAAIDPSEKAGSFSADAASGLAKLGLSKLDLQGLLYDRDTVAFYGDPAWIARMADGPRNWEQSLTQTPSGITLTIDPQQGAATFEPVNKNGAQRGGRPIVAFLSEKVKPTAYTVTEGAELAPVLADDFLLVPLPAKGTPTHRFQVRFELKQQAAK